MVISAARRRPENIQHMIGMIIAPDNFRRRYAKNDWKEACYYSVKQSRDLIHTWTITTTTHCMAKSSQIPSGYPAAWGAWPNCDIVLRNREYTARMVCASSIVLTEIELCKFFLKDDKRMSNYIPNEPNLESVQYEHWRVYRQQNVMIILTITFRHRESFEYVR